MKNKVTSDTFLQSLLDSAANGIISTSTDGIITTFNKAAEEMLGYKADELVGKQSPAIFHDLQQVINRTDEYNKKLGLNIEPGFQTFVCHCEKGLNNEFEWIYIHKDGTRIPVLLSITPILDINDELCGYLGVARDISARKRLELEKQLSLAENRRLESRLENILNFVPVGIFETNLQGECLYVNKTWLNLSGLSQEQAMGHGWASALHPEDRDLVFTEWKKASEENRPFNLRYRFLNQKTNKSHYVMGRSCQFFDEQGEPIGYLGVIIDQTEEVKFEKWLEDERKKSQRNSKLASIGQLAAGVGHEINNPLAIIKGNIDLMNLELDRKGLYDRSRLLKLSDATSRIGKIVDGLREFARSDSEDEKTFNIESSIKRMLRLVAEIYQKDGIEIQTEFTNASHFVVGNEGKFQQVLINLIANAKDAVADREEPLIKLKTITEGNKIQIIVEDNGTGMTTDIKEKIFESFFTTKPIGQGTGMGLGISREILLRMNGTIDCESTLGLGTSFTLALPVLSESGDLQQDVAPPRQKTLLSGTALVADDEEEIREILAELLTNFGLSVTLVSDGLEAYEMAKNQEFDFIFSDMQMPRMSGRELIESCKKELKHSPVYVIISGGVDMATDTNPKSHEIADVVISKPFSIRALQDALKPFSNTRKEAA